jgi:hypothetical protein
MGSMKWFAHVHIANLRALRIAREPRDRSSKTFNAVLAKAPNCAMAHWGVALSTWGNPFGGLKNAKTIETMRISIETAKKTGSPTPRDRAYIDVVATLMTSTDPGTHPTRIAAYEAAIGKLVGQSRRRRRQDLLRAGGDPGGGYQATRPMRRIARRPSADALRARAGAPHAAENRRTQPKPSSAWQCCAIRCAR